MHTVKVNVGKGYEVKIGAGLLSCAGQLVKDVLGQCRVAIITDSNVLPLYGEKVQKSLENAGLQAHMISFPAGEENKTLQTVGTLLERLSQLQLTRSDAVVALGGGVVGDMAGFAAAIYLRGVRYVQIPTTLLAAVDSSVGGKTAVDLGAGKNLAGAFKQPELVICDTDTLKTLPHVQIQSGMAEAIKTAVLQGEDLMEKVENPENADFTEIITRCVRYKAHIVEIDEKEKNERKLLNLGHTIGHAIEKCSNFQLPHGHCVAIGMAFILRAGEKLGITDTATSQRVEKCLQSWGLPTDTDYPTDALCTVALSDKKRSGDSITFVFAEKIGSCIFKKVPISEVSDYIEKGKN